MKLLILFLVLAISAQPLQAGFCEMDMGKNQQTSHHMDKSNDAGHDCCDSEDPDSQEGCDNGMNCGMCFVNASALPSVMRFTPTWEHGYSTDFLSTLVLPSHSSPPFRPPIS
jgi:hypothetical protein